MTPEVVTSLHIYVGTNTCTQADTGEDKSTSCGFTCNCLALETA